MNSIIFAPEDAFLKLTFTLKVILLFIVILCKHIKLRENKKQYYP
ncbi:hypothetical protein PBCV1_a228aR [Paramecium bursaria Chlorella virus 1]|uniref:Uncharacterized protein n=1 Tax=Paramecium bursaria Chlorella virus 1 TaxID=10506 RepID=F8TTZ9_PBCV1|nr:hypothetical protein PBCV1_a228aR [Paramecium bursaria Chlorella virus 1]AEI70060.1 hypothetical protein [Paramecium bursaria Chlorella virus 1]